MMYLIDNDSDALYTVRQIQVPSPSALIASPGATGAYLPYNLVRSSYVLR